MSLVVLRRVAPRTVTFFLAILSILLAAWRRRRRRPRCPGIDGGHWLLGNLPDVYQAAMRHEHLDRLVEFHEKHGPTFCVDFPGKPWLLDTVCPRNVEYILKNQFSNFEKGSWMKTPLNELLGDGIFNVDGPLWYAQRKTSSRMFTAQLFKDHIWHVVKKNSQKLSRILETASDQCETVDIFKLMNRFTLDTIGEIGFGTDIGSLDDPSSPFLASFDHAQIASFYRFILPAPLWRIIRFLGLGSEKGSARHFQLLDDYSRKVARELSAEIQKEGSCKTGPSFVGLFLQEVLGKGEKPTEQFLRDLVLNFLIAGRDTTAQALSWAVFLLIEHPNVEAKLLQELEEVLGTERPEETEGPTYEQISQMPYLQAVVNEALRLYPSVPIDSKVARTDDTLPDGTFIVAGTVVQFNPYSMGRSKSLWGPDAASFRPERWLEMKEVPSPYLYCVFNAGPRECLGKRLAYMEMKACLATILRRVSLKLTVSRDLIRPSASLTIGMSCGLPCTVHRRQ